MVVVTYINNLIFRFLISSDNYLHTIYKLLTFISVYFQQLLLLFYNDINLVSYNSYKNMLDPSI